MIAVDHMTRASGERCERCMCIRSLTNVRKSNERSNMRESDMEANSEIMTENEKLLIISIQSSADSDTDRRQSSCEKHKEPKGGMTTTIHSLICPMRARKAQSMTHQEAVKAPPNARRTRISYYKCKKDCEAKLEIRRTRHSHANSNDNSRISAANPYENQIKWRQSALRTWKF